MAMASTTNKSSLSVLVLLLQLLLSPSRGFVDWTRRHAGGGIYSRPHKNVRVPPERLLPLCAQKIYFDIEVANEPLGRLVFQLSDPSPLPKHTENLIELCRGSRKSIDPLAHYVGCQFDYSPATIEDGSGRYRWGHVLKGRGRNAVGRPDEPIVDTDSQRLCTHSCFGGQYYGEKYDEGKEEGDPGVILTVPVAGPGRGTSRFSIVRVGESPPEWRERLLLNSGVVGRLVTPVSLDTLYAMARQRNGPPTVVGSGVLVDE